MIVHILLISVITWSLITCEPPVSSYLPPSSGSSRPSSQYGPPGSGGRGGSSSVSGRPGSQNQINHFQNGGQSGSSSLSNQYVPPASPNFNQRPGSSGFGGSPQSGFSGSPQSGSGGSQNGFGQSQASQPSSLYGSPSQFGGSRGGSSERLTSGQGFGQGSSGRNQRPETSYGPPPTGDFQSSNAVGSGKNSQQQSVQQGEVDSFGSPNGFGSQGGTPSALYGAPGFGNNAGSPRSGQLRGQNGNFDGEDSNEPAKYQFSYEVDDAQTGTKFGHSEQRDGDLATGEYNVVLPDGRKQVVEYEAGLQGYKPQIRYEGSIGGQGGSQGFQQGGSNGYAEGNSNNGFSPQNGSPSRYQEASALSEAGAGQGEGYPREGPSRGVNGGFSNNGLGGNGFGFTEGSSGPGNGHGRGGQSGQSGGNGGYPSGGPQNGGGFSRQSSGQSGSGGGYSSGGPQSGGSLSNGGDKGYPSGGPSGTRGSGY